MSRDTAESTTVRLDSTGADLLEIVFDNPTGRAVVLTRGVLDTLEELVGQVEQRVQAGALALIIRSAVDGMFIAGMNVDEIADVTDPEVARDAARRVQRMFLRIERLGIPTVAAIGGTCLGGGTELALACDWRIAADRPETKIGLPEVKLGIIPGFGGTTRLPRLIGLQAALPLILTGSTVDARKAQRIGLIHERVHPSMLEQRARELAREAAEGRRPDDRPGLLPRLLAKAPARKLVVRQARRSVLKETGGHYPAPLAALDVIDRGLGLPVEEQLEIEAQALGDLVVSDVSKNLIHVFRLMEAAKKAGPEAAGHPVERAAVLGAGVMGGGVAQLLAYNGIGVRMKDINADALGSGLQHAQTLFDKAVQRRKMHRRDADQAMRRIAPALDYAGFGSVDLVIEAVIERLDVKKTVLREVEERVGAECVLTSNTSSLSITEMGSALADPSRFAGMHFFNPVHRMPLVEVVRGEASSDEAVATVFRLARDLGKTPIVVRDGPGFLVNRLLAPYLNEAGWLLDEGGSIDQIDRVMKEFGMPMGPFRLLDEVGLDVARHAAETMHAAFGERFEPSPVLARLADIDRLGRKSGSGFYSYDEPGGREQEIDESVHAELGIDHSALRQLSDEAIRRRLLFVMVNEAARVLEDDIVDGPGDVDLGLITGTGFPPFRGGLLQWADDIGVAEVHDALERWAQEIGPRFAPAASLASMAAGGEAFYP